VHRAANEQSRMIHLPEHVSRRLHKVRKAAGQLAQENGLDPLPEQIAETCRMEVSEVIDLLNIIEQPVSLDVSTDDDSYYSVADVLEDTVSQVPSEVASQYEDVDMALAILTPRERAVIMLRYGIDDGQSRTLLEVGKELGISRERVRQLEGVALRKMRPYFGC
jgi:RNA polymerase primary sigma factor